MQNHERLRAVWDVERKKQKLTQYEAARRLGIKQTTFSQYLNGHSEFGDTFAHKTASLLGCAPTDLKPDYLPPAELLMVSNEPTPAGYTPLLSTVDILDISSKEKQLSDFKKTVNPELPSGDARGVFVTAVNNNSNAPLITTGSRVAINTTRTLSMNNYHLIIVNGAPVIALFNGIDFEFCNGNKLNATPDDVAYVGQAVHVLTKSLVA